MLCRRASIFARTRVVYRAWFRIFESFGDNASVAFFALALALTLTYSVCI